MPTRLVTLAIAGLVLAACGEPEPAGGALPPPSGVTTPATTSISGSTPTHEPAGEAIFTEDPGPVVELLGRPLADFETGVAELGLGPVRIAWQDGDHLAITEDLRPGRVNVAVENRDGTDVVVDAFVEADSETGALGPEATIVDTYEGVSFYPACGNEPLDHDGVTWYQVNEYEYPDLYDEAARGLRENLPESVITSGFAPRVAEPGPGDDVGTLVVWSDDVAYFVSDSGDLTAWLVRRQLTYDWVC